MSLVSSDGVGALADQDFDICRLVLGNGTESQQPTGPPFRRCRPALPDAATPSSLLAGDKSSRFNVTAMAAAISGLITASIRSVTPTCRVCRRTVPQDLLPATNRKRTCFLQQASSHPHGKQGRRKALEAGRVPASTGNATANQRQTRSRHSQYSENGEDALSPGQDASRPHGSGSPLGDKRHCSFGTLAAGPSGSWLAQQLYPVGGLPAPAFRRPRSEPD